MSSTRYVLPGFHELLLKTTVFAVMLLAASFFLGMRCGRSVSDAQTGAVVKKERARQQQLEAALESERHVKDSLSDEIAVLASVLDADDALADSLHQESLTSETGLTITDVDTVPAVAIHRALSLDTTFAVDTVKYADVQRPNDERHYSVPKFFTDSYVKLRADRNGAYVVAHDQHDIIAALMAKSVLADSMQVASDSINASLARQVTALENTRHPWCGAKCGAGITLGILTAAAFTLNSLRR